jgi:hypothetical protein
MDKPTNIREYADGHEVTIGERQHPDCRLVIKATNEGGHNGTEVDLQDVLDWCAMMHQDLFNAAAAKANAIFDGTAAKFPSVKIADLLSHRETTDRP